MQLKHDCAGDKVNGHRPINRKQLRLQCVEGSGTSSTVAALDYVIVQRDFVMLAISFSALTRPGGRHRVERSTLPNIPIMGRPAQKEAV